MDDEEIEEYRNSYWNSLSPVVTQDLHVCRSFIMLGHNNNYHQTYLKFVPTYEDRGTILLPAKLKKKKVITKESEQQIFDRKVWELDDRQKANKRLPKRLYNKFKPAFDALVDYDRMVNFLLSSVSFLST